jgi:hypothetical protein
MAGEPVSIFFSYSRKDEALRQELDDHLATLKRSGLVDSWYDGCIGAGDEWERQITHNLKNAQIILLLISVDFIKSDFCHQVELTEAIKRHKAGDAHVIPVLMRSCMWKPTSVGDMQLGDLQALPKDAKPISKWTDRDDAFTNIAEGLYEKILQVQQEQAQAQYHAKQNTYTQAFAQALQAAYPLSQETVGQLKIFPEYLTRQLDGKARKASE